MKVLSLFSIYMVSLRHGMVEAKLRDHTISYATEMDPIIFMKPAYAGECATGCYKSDSDPPYNYCDYAVGFCVHKDVFPQTGLEMAGILVFGFIMAACTVAGIGGGGVTSSLLMAFFYFDTKNAIAISTLSILICSAMRYVYNINARHPVKKEQNMIDYGIASVMMPLTLAGS